MKTLFTLFYGLIICTLISPSNLTASKRMIVENSSPLERSTKRISVDPEADTSDSLTSSSSSSDEDETIECPHFPFASLPTELKCAILNKLDFNSYLKVRRLNKWEKGICDWFLFQGYYKLPSIELMRSFDALSCEEHDAEAAGECRQLMCYGEEYSDRAEILTWYPSESKLFFRFDQFCSYFLNDVHRHPAATPFQSAFLSLFNPESLPIFDLSDFDTDVKGLSFQTDHNLHISPAYGLLKHIERFEATKTANCLLFIPDAVWALKSLKRVYLQNCGIQRVSMFMTHLPLLQVLVLDNNPLVQFDHDLLNLTSLKTLSMNSCGLQELPEGISDLSNLEQLYLQNNMLTEIPNSITSLTPLTFINLAENQLRSFPFMNHFPNLEVLNLYENNLEWIYVTKSTMPKLEEIAISQNFIQHSGINHHFNLEVSNTGQKNKGPIRLN